MRQIQLRDTTIVIVSDYDPALLPYLRGLPDRTWIVKRKCWTMPATPFHARQVIATLKPFGFEVEPAVARLARPITGTLTFKRAIEDRFPSLRPYQVEGVDFLMKRNGRVLVADDMGLGKTIEALAYLGLSGERRVLIVAPTTALYNWQREIKDWLGLEALVLDSTRSYIPPVSQILITSYTLATIAEEDWVWWKPKVLILDEAHYIKDPKSKRSQALVRIGRAASHVLALTGTPMMNRVNELWPILNLIDPGSWPSRWQFIQRYQHGNPAFRGADNADELSDRLRDVMIRRTKMEVADQLPPLTRAKIRVQLPPVDQAQYNEARRDLIEWLKRNGLPHERAQYSEALVKISVLRQITGRGKVVSALAWAGNFLDSTDEKLILFAVHKDVVARLEAGLEKYGVVKIVGDASARDRDAAVERFQRGNDRVMLLSKAGSEAITLHRSSNVLFVERAWNPATEEQVESRAQRLGQEHAVTAWYLVAPGIDSRMDWLIDHKRATFKEVVGQDDIETMVMDLLREEMNE